MAENSGDIDERLIPEVNIGLVGHVDHGKTTLVEALTGQWADTHSEEQKRGITIRLGYADSTIYECMEEDHEYPLCTGEKCPKCFGDTEPVRTLSFVDAPGHSTLMATVLSGTALMDGALLIVAADEECPQPQTLEHLIALDIVGIENIIIVQNKVDAVSEERVRESHEEIREFTEGTVAEDAPIIPVSALQRVNVDALLDSIQENIPTPQRDPGEEPKVYLARSFDVNRPGTPYEDLLGGVVGGSIVQGRLEKGDEIEIRPGVDRDGEWKPLTTSVTNLQKAGFDLEEAGPGGLLGISTKLDPALTKSDALAGQVAGHPEELPPMHSEVLMDINLLDTMAGTDEPPRPVKTGDALMITAAVEKTAGAVTSARKEGEEAEINLKRPLCADYGDRVAISRMHSNRWRLIGYGILKEE